MKTMQPPTPAFQGSAQDNFFARLPMPHFFRYVVLDICLVASIYALLVPFLLWQAAIMDKTGYRKSDLLWMLVPIAGTITCTRTQWRHCARTRYWEPSLPTDVPAAVSAAA